MKLTKLDGRHTGSSDWKYYCELPFRLGSVPDRKIKFNEMREWCWNTWGASKELTDYDHTDLFDGVYCSNNHWCWMNERHGHRRIYLKSDAEAELFTLRWL